jgi:hypothetical protein
MTSAVGMLRRASWQAEKLFKARGYLRTMIWVTETKDGRRQMFETACEVAREEISDRQALAALCAELRDDFICDGVVRYGVAFPARASTLLSSSILQLDVEHRRHEVVALEAHDADEHLRAHREILRVNGVPYLAALGPIKPGVAHFDLLLQDARARCLAACG